MSKVYQYTIPWKRSRTAARGYQIIEKGLGEPELHAYMCVVARIPEPEVVHHDYYDHIKMADETQWNLYEQAGALS